MASFQCFCCNGCVVMAFASPIRQSLQTKVLVFLSTGYTRKHRRVVKDFLANENAALAVRTFHNLYQALKLEIRSLKIVNNITS